MTPDNDPSFSAQILSWIINAIFAIALLVGRLTFSRSMQKQDEMEKRIRSLERNSVTHEDLRRIEGKIDEHNRQVTDRLDRILERNNR